MTTTNTLWDSTLVASRFDVLTTELNAMITSVGNTATISTVGGTSGVFNQSQTGGAIYADAEFIAGGTYTPLAGGFLELWVIRSLDGTNYEDGTGAGGLATTATIPGRPADIIIPVRAGTTITPRAGASGLILPPANWKALVRNQTGATLPATGNKISIIAYGPAQ